MRNLLKISLVFLLCLTVACHKSTSPATKVENEYVVITVPVNFGIEQEIKDGPLVEELHLLEERAHIADPITIKKFDYMDYIFFGDGNATIEKTYDGHAIISLSKYYYDGRAKKDTIEAVLAHELGHWKYRHCDRTNSAFRKKLQKKEAEADTFAIQLVGKEVFYSGFEHFGADFDGADAKLTFRLKRMRKFHFIK